MFLFLPMTSQVSEAVNFVLFISVFLQQLTEILAQSTCPTNVCGTNTSIDRKRREERNLAAG